MMEEGNNTNWQKSFLRCLPELASERLSEGQFVFVEGRKEKKKEDRRIRNSDMKGTSD